MVDLILRSFSPMRFALAVVLSLIPAATALAQSDSQMLIDPATGETRFLPPLKQPWQFQGPTRPAKAPAAKTASAPSESFASEPPKPKKQRRVAAAPEPALRDVPADSEPAPKPKKQKPVAAAPEAPPVSAEPVTKPKKQQVAAVAPQAAPQATPKPAKSTPTASTLPGFDNLQTLTLSPTKPAAKPVEQKPAPAPKAEAPKPVQQASIAPAKPNKPVKSRAGYKDTVTFSPNASDPSAAAVSAVRGLAGTLGNALSDGNARIQLIAYAGQRGEKTSDTRRLSLKRALVVRQLLIDDGIPSERIDVFAQGGSDDEGPLDRVDVLVKG